jgi:hypothetical protein
MTIPVPPQDNSGGYVVLKYSSGTTTHRWRFHVAPFNADSTGTYITVPSGFETSVTDTFNQLAFRLKPDVPTAFTITLDAVYQVVSHVPFQVFTITSPAGVAGTSGTAAGPTESFKSYNFRSSGGLRFRFFRFSFPGWAYAAATTITGADSTSEPQLVYYLTQNLPTGTARKTQIVAHDGTALNGPAHVTFGTNKKLRRRAGNA